MTVESAELLSRCQSAGEARPALEFAANAFGLRWESDYPLSQFGPALAGTRDVTVERADCLSERFGGQTVNNGEVFPDGARFRFGDAVFDTFDGQRVIWWSPTAEEIPAAFYGTIVAIVLAWRGLVPLHGSAVEIDGRALLIAGPAGAGKSTLCESLTRKGARLISDDLSVLLATSGAVPMLQPGRPAIRLQIPGRATGDKALHEAPRVNGDAPIELAWLAVLGADPIRQGPVEASEMLRRQVFRPTWMRALPHARERAATIFYAAQRITMFSAPAARDRPDLSADDKADMILARLSSADASADWR